jgi:uncharacterized protein (TIGR02117 family)
MIFTKSLQFILRFLFLTTLITILYFLIAHFLTFFIQKEEDKKGKNKEVYILYNTMHSDIVLAIKSIKNKNLQAKLQPFIRNRKGYLAFGWGDKETYLNTPTWEDISLSTSLKALFINTPSLMHLSYIPDIHRYTKIKKINVSSEQLDALEKTLFKSFTQDTDKQYKGYGRDDLFYPSIYTYNLFHTCNTWTGDQLREANVSMSYWTPLSSNVIDSLP